MLSTLYPGVAALAMLLLVTSSACWKASRPETPVESMSPTVQLLPRSLPSALRSRHGGGKLEGGGRPGRAAARERRAHLGRDRGQLAGIIRIGGVAALLQSRSERLDARTAAEGGVEARVAGEQRDIILKA